jgi:prepilin-type N-terminal cleavage/methylation domain-containing protein
MRSRRRNQRGFTLLEALAATTLFAIVSAAMGTLAVGSIRATTFNRHASQAALLAQWEMERVRALEYASMVNASTTKVMGGQTYTLATLVEPNTPAANMARITVTASWTGPEGAKSYATQTIYTDVTL